MTSLNNQHESEAEKLFIEQARAYFRDVQAVGHSAPDGQVINQMEAVILKRSRELIQQSFQLALQEEIKEHEKKRNSVRNVKRKKGKENRNQKKSSPPSEPSS